MSFTRLTAIKRSHKDTRGKWRWLCQCKCGKTTTPTIIALLSGNTKSCGCLKRDKTALRNTTHGMSKLPEYQLWCAMITRCENKNDDKRWAVWGGRGIGICKRWRSSFPDFLSDVGKRPGNNYSLDRADVDGWYSCGSCQECVANSRSRNGSWATNVTQARNRRNNYKISAFGTTKCAQEWAETTGLPRGVIVDRIRVLGWPAEEALTRPAKKRPTAPSIADGLPRRGIVATAEHVSWRCAKSRCFGEYSLSFKRYSTLGITMCVGWREHGEGFFRFLADMGPKPSHNHSLDRINSAGHYSCGHCEECIANNWPMNCRWATIIEQSNNKLNHGAGGRSAADNYVSRADNGTASVASASS